MAPSEEGIGFTSLHGMLGFVYQSEFGPDQEEGQNIDMRLQEEIKPERLSQTL